MKAISKIYIYSMGCPRRLMDAQKISEYFKINGCQIVKNPLRADYIILNTCAFKDSQEDFAIKKIEEFKKLDKNLIVGGCLPAINPKRLEKVFNGLTFTTKSINQIDNIFDLKIKFQELPDANKTFIKSSLLSLPFFYDFFRGNFLRCFSSLYKLRARILEKNYYITISRGCLGKCSYCGIKNAIGPLKSKNLRQCKREFKEGIARGYTYFILEADDLGAYGLDIKSSFPNLLREFLRNPGDYKLALPEFHPRWLVKYLNEMVSIVRTGKVAEISCPIQSGSNRILRLMNRYCEIEEIKSAFNKLKEANPQLILLTQIIVGFPGETEDDFDKTIRFVKDLNVDYTFFYPFSKRPGTVAASLPNKISEEIIKERIKKAKKEGI